MGEAEEVKAWQRLACPKCLPGVAFATCQQAGLLGIQAQAEFPQPQFVKPFVKSNKNDMRDTEAIAEAVMRPTMHFVPTKEIDQQDMQALHRVRERLIGARTALINEVHGLMHESGIVLPKGVAKFRQAVVDTLESEQEKLTALSQEMFRKLVGGFGG